MGAGPTFFLSTCRLHHHTQLSPVRLPPHWFSCFFYLVLNLSPPPVSQNAPPTPTSPFILPSPSGPANPCPSGHLTGVQRPVRWPRSSNTLQVCGRGEQSLSHLKTYRKSDTLSPHGDPFSTCPSRHAVTCRRLFPCLHHSMLLPVSGWLDTGARGVVPSQGKTVLWSSHCYPSIS